MSFSLVRNDNSPVVGLLELVSISTKDVDTGCLLSIIQLAFRPGSYAWQTCGSCDPAAFGDASAEPETDLGAGWGPEQLSCAAAEV